MVVSAKVKSNNLDVKVTGSELETEGKGTEEESTRESDSNMLDVSSDYPRGLLINSTYICVVCLRKEGEKVEIVGKKGKGNV